MNVLFSNNYRTDAMSRIQGQRGLCFATNVLLGFDFFVLFQLMLFDCINFYYTK